VLRPDLHHVPSILNRNTFKGLGGSGRQRSPSSSLSTITQQLDAREQFAIGPLDDTAFPTPKIPESLISGFNEVVESAYTEIRSSCNKLVEAIEKGLDAPKGFITGPTAGGAGAELNLNFYAQVVKDVLEDSGRNEDAGRKVMRRIWPHSDLGVVSALFQDGTGASGLEIQVRSSSSRGGGNEFAPVSIEEDGDVVLLVSDTLERWTNGYLRAAVHRVSPPSLSGAETNVEPEMALVPERRSAVMFFRAPPATDLGPLSSFVSAQNPAKYERVRADEYLKAHNRRLC
jgi:hypothetical protein